MKSREVSFSATFLIAIALSIGSSLFLSFFVTIIALHYNLDINSIASSEVFIYISAILPQLCFLGIFLYYKFKKNLEINFLPKENTFSPFALYPVVILLSIITLLGSLNFTYLGNYIFSFFANPSSLDLPVDNVLTFIFSSLFLCLLPAVFEEILFRGILFESLRKKFSLPLAIILSAFCFALMHMSLFSFIHQFLLGIILALLAYFTGSIVYGMVFHFINNFAVILIEFAFGGAFPLIFAEYSLLNVVLIFGIFALTVGVVFLFFFLLRKKKSLNDTKIETSTSLEIQQKENTLLNSDETSEEVLNLDKYNEDKEKLKREKRLIFASFAIAILLNLMFTFLA